jgi:hypothetical protein
MHLMMAYRSDRQLGPQLGAPPPCQEQAGRCCCTGRLPMMPLLAQQWLPRHMASTHLQRPTRSCTAPLQRSHSDDPRVRAKSGKTSSQAAHPQSSQKMGLSTLKGVIGCQCCSHQPPSTTERYHLI